MDELGFQDANDLKDTIQELNLQLKRLEPIEVMFIIHVSGWPC